MTDHEHLSDQDRLDYYRCLSERDRLRARVRWLRRAYGKLHRRRISMSWLLRDINAARLSAKAQRDRMTEQATEAGIACMEIEGRYHDLEDECARLRAVIDALREWQKAREQLLAAYSIDDEDRATEALDVAGQAVLAKLQELDEAKEVPDG